MAATIDDLPTPPFWLATRIVRLTARASSGKRELVTPWTVPERKPQEQQPDWGVSRPEDRGCTWRALGSMTVRWKSSQIQQGALRRVGLSEMPETQLSTVPDERMSIKVCLRL